MASRTSRNSVLAGLFVIISVLLMTAVIIILSNLGDRFKKRHEYIVVFSVADGAEGLNEGAAVKVGGQRVGHVIKTEIMQDQATLEPIAVEVTVAIEDRIKLYSDADVQLNKPLLGSGSSINIVSVSGMPRPTLPGSLPVVGPLPLTRLNPGERIPGRIGPPGFLAQSDYGKIQTIVDRVDRITAEAEPRFTRMMADAEATVAHVRSVASNAEERWPVWSESVSAVLARIEKSSEQFDAIVTNVRNGTATLESGAKDARDVIASARAAIDDNRKSLDEIVQNVRQLTEKANTTGYDGVAQAIDRTNQFLATASSAAKQADELLARNAPQIDDAITNATLASQQLKLATVEIRSAPWRLLYQPTKKELSNELLYNSVRQYSDAVGQLKQAADALKAMSARSSTGGPAVDQPTLDRLTAQLQSAFEQYQQQERHFLDRWIEQSEPKSTR